MLANKKLEDHGIRFDLVVVGSTLTLTLTPVRTPDTGVNDNEFLIVIIGNRLMVSASLREHGQAQCWSISMKLSKRRLRVSLIRSECR